MRLKSIKLAFLALFITILSAGAQTAVEQLAQGVKQMEAGDYSSAKIELLKAYSIDQKNDEILNELAFCYYQTNKYKLAIQFANQLIKLKTLHSADGFVTKAAALEALGKSKQASSCYKTGLEKYPQMHKLNQNYALFCLSKREYKTAEYYAIQAILTLKSDPDSHSLLSLIEEKQGFRSKALLAAIYYSILEQDEAKSIESYKHIRKLWWQTPSLVVIEQIRLTKANTDFNGFGQVEKLINEINTTFVLDNAPLKEIETISQANKQLFIFLGQQALNHKGDFWWDFYGNFFSQLEAKGFIPQATLYLARNQYKAEVLSQIAQDVNAFSKYTFWLESETFNNN